MADSDGDRRSAGHCSAAAVVGPAHQRPGDDSAGYAIVQGITSQIGGLNQAAQNASAGVSLTQTGAGALQEITNDLQTMRDLAVESLNATNSFTDRADLNQEYQQLAADIDNVARTAAFNGVNLLDGTFAGAAFQIGANAGQTITVASVASARTSALGTSFTAALVGTAPAGGNPLANGDLAFSWGPAASRSARRSMAPMARAT